MQLFYLPNTFPFYYIPTSLLFISQFITILQHNPSSFSGGLFLRKGAFTVAFSGNTKHSVSDIKNTQSVSSYIHNETKPPDFK